MCHWESAFPPLGLHNVNLVSPVRLWECRIVIVILGIIMAGGLEQMTPISAPLKLDKKESGIHGLKASFLGGNTAFLWKNDNRGKTCEPQCVRGLKRKSKNCLTNQKSYFMQKCSAGCIYITKFSFHNNLSIFCWRRSTPWRWPLWRPGGTIWWGEAQFYLTRPLL